MNSREGAAVRERVRELERLGVLGITLQQPLGLNFRSAWKLIS